MKKVFTVLLLLICLLDSYSQKKDSHEKWIDSLLKTNKQDFVENLLKEQLKDKKKQNYANRCLGYFYLNNKKYDLSEKYYQAELLSKPKCAECHYYLGRVYSRKKNVKKALLYLNKAVLLEPKNGYLYANRAKFKTEHNDKIGAQIDYDKAIEIDPNDADLYSLRAKYFFQERLLTLALIDCSKAININPKDFNNYLQRAQISFSQYKYDEALKDIEKAISLNPNQELSYNLRSIIYATQGDYFKANSDLEKAIELNPNEFMAFFMRSKIRYKAEDMNGSCEDLSKSLELLDLYDSDNNLKSEIEISIADYCKIAQPSYYFQRGIANYNMREFEKSIAIYSEGLEKFPKNSMTLSFRGNSYFETNQFEKAIADYELSNQNVANLILDMRLNPNYASMENSEFDKYVNGTLATNHLMSSKSKFALEKYEDALLEIENGIKIAPDLSEFGLENYYNVRGLILMALGENEKAIADFDKCLQIKVSLPIALINRAIAKINLKSQVKYRSSFITLNSPTAMYFGRWNLPLQSKIEYNITNLKEALQDCNQAIRENSEIGYAYYVRGAIKKLLENEDYCKDFKKAKSLDYQFDESILENCK